MIASVSAAFCYGISTNYTKVAPKLEAFNNAHGSMWAATLLMLPLAFLIPVREAVTTEVAVSVLALGVLSTGVAYLIFFRLVTDIGPSPTLSVTFLIPAFGIFWGYLFLDEPVGWNTLIGTILVVLGTVKVTGGLGWGRLGQRNTLGATACEACPAGTASGFAGAESIATCVACAEDTISGVGSAACSACGFGQMSNHGNTACVLSSSMLITIVTILVAIFVGSGALAQATFKFGNKRVFELMKLAGGGVENRAAEDAPDEDAAIKSMNAIKSGVDHRPSM